MQLQTFKAPTMAEALTQVKSAMGSDAIILHTRTFQVRSCMGLRRKEMVEITAGKGMNIGSRRRPGESGGAAGGHSGGSPGGAGGKGGQGGSQGGGKPGTYTRTGAPARPPAADVPPVPPRPGSPGGRQQLLETPVATSAAVLGLSQEISALKDMVKDLVNTTRRQRMPEVPEDLFDYYITLIQNEVAEELATDIVKTI